MALQSSGAISISQVKAEKGETSNSLTTLSTTNINQNSAARPDEVAPHSMSEWYSYDHSAAPAYQNIGYYKGDGVNDYVEYTNGNGSINFGQDPITISFWVRQDSAGHKNAQMINFAPGFDKNNRIMIDYNVNNSKLRFNHRSDGTNTMHEFYMNTGANQGASGIDSEWVAGDRGITDQDGFTMLTYTYDPNLPGLDGLTVYWNDQPLTANATFNGTRNPLSVVNARVGENIHTTNSAGCANMGIDEIKIFAEALTSNQVTAIYSAGKGNYAQSNVGPLVTEISFDTTVNDSAGYFQGAAAFNGGGIANY
jgi:hypothetical protein